MFEYDLCDFMSNALLDVFDERRGSECLVNTRLTVIHRSESFAPIEII